MPSVRTSSGSVVLRCIQRVNSERVVVENIGSTVQRAWRGGSVSPLPSCVTRTGDIPSLSFSLFTS